MGGFRLRPALSHQRVAVAACAEVYVAEKFRQGRPSFLKERSKELLLLFECVAATLTSP
jgi:hypothetical protein